AANNVKKPPIFHFISYPPAGPCPASSHAALATGIGQCSGNSAVLNAVNCATGGCILRRVIYEGGSCEETVVFDYHCGGGAGHHVFEPGRSRSSTGRRRGPAAGGAHPNDVER